MGNGYQNKVAWIDLTHSKIQDLNYSEKKLRTWLGGKGLGTKIIWDFIKELEYKDIDISKMDAFDPNNLLVFATGPGTGIGGFPSSSRYHVMAIKSPQTGSIGSANSGGDWGTFLKSAGYDALVVQGQSQTPIYLSVINNEIKILDARDVWGTTTFDMDEKLKKIHQSPDFKISVLGIGPAGENRSLIAAIMNDKYRAAGRTGLGAIMGSKNLKAIVVGGNQKIEISDRNKFMEVAKKTAQMLKENSVTGEGLPTYGTAVLVNIVNEVGSLPFKNWQFSYNKEADKISGESLKQDYLIKNYGCHGCTIKCGRISRVTEGPYAIDYSEGPEYESIWALGNSCAVMDMGAIIKANHLCNEFGLDTISMGSTIACAMELNEKGKIPKEDLQGFALQFGNPTSLVEGVWRAAYGVGIGKYLSMGARKLAQHYQMPGLSMECKGLEMPAYDPRGIKGIGLNFATANRGGCHVTGYTIAPEIIGMPEQLDRLAYEGKAQWVKAFQDLTSVVNSTVNCLFTTFALGAKEFAELLSPVTGWDMTDSELMTTGERIYNLERLILGKLGIEAQDSVPKRLLNDPIPEGPSKGNVFKLDEILKEYYKLRGWDELGRPTEEKLDELGIPVEAYPTM